MNDDEDDSRLLIARRPVTGFFAHLGRSRLLRSVDEFISIMNFLQMLEPSIKTLGMHGTHDMFTLSEYENYVRDPHFSIGINDLIEFSLVRLP